MHHIHSIRAEGSLQTRICALLQAGSGFLLDAVVLMTSTAEFAVVHPLTLALPRTVFFIRARLSSQRPPVPSHAESEFLHE
jgi:hypothetical protein